MSTARAILAVIGALLLSPGLCAADDAAALKPSAANCLACHREPALLPERGTHRAAGSGCQDCHQESGEHPRAGAGSITAFGARAATPVAEQNTNCISCHARDLAGWHGGSHDSADTACASCHRAHVSRDPMGNARLQVDTCVSCHTRARLDLQKPFSHPVADGMPGCSACHAPHDSAVTGSLRRPTVNESCYECHAEKRGPFLFEHPPAAEDCTLCHAPHGAIHPAMLTRRAPLLCQQCHSQAGHPSIVSTPGGLPGGSPSPLLLAGNCLNCHSQVHGSNHPSGVTLSR